MNDYEYILYARYLKNEPKIPVRYALDYNILKSATDRPADYGAED